ncbi:MAG TPA: succinate dehydrogenase, hydrophobic membrane anchor protein [Alphaproteobacteria bacterium]|nr:succinate dehydrogenase, hydrophobic membrane anchor protein [Alphaproteobacteria bacterium]
MSYRSPLARARGLGSAREGAGHWWAQRLTAVALVPLCLWFVIGLLEVIGEGYEAAADWISLTENAALLVLFVVAAFHHAQLGLQVVIEDYVHHEGLKIAGIIIVKFAAILLGFSAIFAVLSISFGG